MASETKIVITAATAQAEASLAKLGQSIGGVSRQMFDLSSVVGTLGGALTVTAFAGMIKSSIDAADRLNDLSKVTSLLPSQLAGIGFAAEQSGSDLEGVAHAVSKLAENMGKDADKFAKVGISAKDPIEAFKQLADVFNAIEDPQQRAAFASEALGRSWRDAVPLLAEGGKRIGEMSEQGRALAGNQDELSAGADRFNDNLAELQKRIRGAGNSLANDLLPGMIATVEEINKLSAAASDFLPIGGAIKTVFETLVVLGANTGYVFKQVGIEIGGIGAQLAALARGDFEGFSNIGKMMKEDAERARKEIDAFGERILNPQNTLGAQIKVGNKVDTSGVSGFINEGDGASKKLKTEKDKPFDPDGDFWFAVDEAAMKNQQKRNEQYLKDLEKAEEETNKQLQRSALEAQAIIFDIDPIAKASAEWEKLLALKEKGLLTDEQIGKSYAKTFDDISKSGDDSFKSLESAVRGWGNAFTDEMSKMVRTGKLDFASLADSIINDLIRIQIQKNVTDKLVGAGTNWLDGLFKGIGGGGGGSGSSSGFVDTGGFAQMLASANGNVFSGPGIGAYSGSVVDKPTVFPFARGVGLMGEAGPEAILPLTRINGKLGVQAGGGGGGVVVNIIESPGNGGKQQQRQEGGVSVVDVFIEQVKNSIAGDITRGSGAVPAAMSRTYGMNRVAGSY